MTSNSMSTIKRFLSTFQEQQVAKFFVEVRGAIVYEGGYVRLRIIKIDPRQVFRK